MTAPDAPQVEPLTLTLEEALARLGARGYTLAVHHHEEDAPEFVLHDVYSAFARGSFGHWKDAVEAVLGVPVVRRDDTAELVTALEALLEDHFAVLQHYASVPGRNHTAIRARAAAALARVGGGES